MSAGKKCTENLADSQDKFDKGMFDPNANPKLDEMRMHAKALFYRYNATEYRKMRKRRKIIKKLLNAKGTFEIEPPFYCEYGSNITIGNNFFSNVNCTILDECPVNIGDDVMFGPNVGLFSVGHPIEPELRRRGYEVRAPITIGNNVWIGGNSVVRSGVTIGDNVVIGAGSVVTRDIPSNTVAVGNPCKVIKTLSSGTTVNESIAPVHPKEDLASIYERSREQVMAIVDNESITISILDNDEIYPDEQYPIN